MDKVRIIERSVRCYRCGSYGLIPVLGTVPAIIAVLLYHKVRYELGPAWNPAGRHLRWGFTFAWIGLGLTGGLLGLAFVLVLHQIL